MMFQLLLYRFGRRFELPLLIQSILMIAMMFFMVKVCVDVQNKQQIIKQKDRVFTGILF